MQLPNSSRDEAMNVLYKDRQVCDFAFLRLEHRTIVRTRDMTEVSGNNK
jgi:hypothetical protein